GERPLRRECESIAVSRPAVHEWRARGRGADPTRRRRVAGRRGPGGHGPARRRRVEATGHEGAEARAHGHGDAWAGAARPTPALGSRRLLFEQLAELPELGVDVVEAVVHRAWCAGDPRILGRRSLP